MRRLKKLNLKAGEKNNNDDQIVLEDDQGYQGEDVERVYRRDFSIFAPVSESCHVFDSQCCSTSSALAEKDSGQMLTYKQSACAYILMA